jgi:hypothetical protein
MMQRVFIADLSLVDTQEPICDIDVEKASALWKLNASKVHENGVKRNEAGKHRYADPPRWLLTPFRRQK